jgi:hypothetical protein
MMLDEIRRYKSKAAIDIVAEWLASCREISTTRSGKHPRKEAELKRLVIRKVAELMSKHKGTDLGPVFG